MKKLLLISMLIGAMPLSMQAQDDDLYFVPKKKSVEKSVVVDDNVQQPVTTNTDCGRSIDEYNRRMKSSYQVIDGDTVKNDIIDFSAEQGVYPDSVKEEKEDFELTKKLTRFDDYPLADNAAFWAGYQAGIDMWGWHSPWYYSRYGWYGGWYDPWYSPYYYGSWRYGWYDLWFYGYYGWYDPWFYPYYGYYGYYGYPYYRGYPYWGGGIYYPGGGGGGGYAHHSHIGTGTIRSDGSTHAYRHGNSVSGSSSRTSSLRDRTSRMSGGTTYNSGNHERSGSGNFSGYRGNSSSSNSGSYNGGSRSSSSGSFGGSRSSGGGGGGSFSGGSRGGGGGGGNRLGGRR